MATEVTPVAPMTSFTNPGRPVATWFRSPGRGGLARWAVAADALALLLVLAALSIDWFGAYQVRGFVSMTRSTTAWLVAAALLVGRHALVPARPLPLRMLASARHVLGHEAVRVFLLTRVPPLVVAYLAVASFGFQEERPYRLGDTPLGNLQARWDAGWYVGVAFDGYYYEPSPGQQYNVAFFPAYPLLIRAGTAVTLSGRREGLRSVNGVASFIRNPSRFPYAAVREEARWVGLMLGWLISCGAFLAALVLLGRLARDDLPDEAAGAALVLLSAYPFAIFFGAVYTESLYLLCAVGAIYAFRHRRFATAAAWGLAVGLVRPNGMFLAIPLGLAACVELWPGLPLSRWARGRLPRGEARGRAAWLPLVVATTPVVGVLLFSAFLSEEFGRPLAWLDIQGGWNRGFASAAASVDDMWRYLLDHGPVGFVFGRVSDTLNLAATCFALALVWPVTRRFGILYGSFLLVNLLPPLLTGGLESMGRYTAVLFPMFLYLASRLGPSPRAGLVAAFGTLQGLLAALFFTWRPPF